jgi:hypothetical protein
MCVASSTSSEPSTAGGPLQSIQTQLSSAGTSCSTASADVRTRTGPSVITPLPATSSRNIGSLLQRKTVRT